MKKTITMLLAMPSLAFAQSMDALTPPSGDIAVKVISQIFGGLVGGGADPLLSGISNFLGLIMAIAGFLVAYTILVATIGTAHDGEMLGKKLHSVWTPLKTIWGVVLVLPAIKGYALIQVLVMSVVLMGIGLADSVWATYTSSQNLQQTISGGISAPVANQLAYNLLGMEACMDALQANVNDTSIFSGTSSFGVTTVSNSSETIMQFGDKNEANSMTKDQCGSVTINKPAQANQSATSQIVGNLFNAQDVFAVSAPVVQAQTDALNAMISALQSPASQIAQGQSVDPSTIDSIAQAYSTSVLSKAQSALSSTDAYKEIAQNASTGGFFLAGAWFMKLSAIQNNVREAVNSVPVATGVSNVDTSVFGDNWKSAMSAYQKTVLASGSGVLNVGIGAVSGGTDESWFSRQMNKLKDKINVNASIDRLFTHEAFQFNANENPMVTSNRLAGYVSTTATFATVGMGVLMATAGNFPGVGLFLQFISTLILPAMWLVAFTLSILPMVPFFMWFAVIIGWVIQVLEAVVASPIWAIMHLTDGDDLVGSAGLGYKMLLALILKPVLMVFGLISAFVLMNVLGDVFNMVWANVFVMSQVNSGIVERVLSEFVVSPIVYFAMNVMLVTGCLKMIHMADNILNWIGSGSPSLGDSVQSFSGHQGVVAGATGFMASQTANKLGSGVGGASVGGFKNPSNPNAGENTKHEAKIQLGKGNIRSQTSSNGFMGQRANKPASSVAGRKANDAGKNPEPVAPANASKGVDPAKASEPAKSPVSASESVAGSSVAKEIAKEVVQPVKDSISEGNNDEKTGKA